MHLHTGKNLEIYQKWTLNQANQNDWTNETWKKCPMKVIQATMRVLLSLIPPVCLSICTLFPPNKHFTCFITFCLHGNSFSAMSKATALSLTIGLVATICCFHHHDPAPFLAGNEAPLQVIIGQGHPRSYLGIYYTVTSF